MQPNFPRRGWGQRPHRPLNRPGTTFRAQGPPRSDAASRPPVGLDVTLGHPSGGLSKGHGHHHPRDPRSGRGLLHSQPPDTMHGTHQPYGGHIRGGLNNPANPRIGGRYPPPRARYATPSLHSAHGSIGGQPISQGGRTPDGVGPSSGALQIPPLVVGTPLHCGNRRPSNAPLMTPSSTKPDHGKDVHQIRPLMLWQPQRGVNTGDPGAPLSTPANDANYGAQQTPTPLFAGYSNLLDAIPNFGRTDIYGGNVLQTPRPPVERLQGAGDAMPAPVIPPLIWWEPGGDRVNAARDQTARPSSSRKLQGDEGRSGSKNESVPRGTGGSDNVKHTQQSGSKNESVLRGTGSGDDANSKGNFGSPDRKQLLVTISASPGVNSQGISKAGCDERTRDSASLPGAGAPKNQTKDPKMGVAQKRTPNTADRTGVRGETSSRGDDESVGSSASSRSDRSEERLEGRGSRNKSPDSLSKEKRGADNGDRRAQSRDSRRETPSDHRDRDHSGWGSRDKRGRSSHSQGKSRASSDARYGRDRQSIPRDDRATSRPFDYRGRRNAPPGPGEQKRGQRSDSSRDRRSSSVSSRAERSSSVDQRERHSSSSWRERSPSRRKRSLSPVDERMSKRPRNTGSSSREGSTAREADRRGRESSRRPDTARSERRKRERSPATVEDGELPDEVGEVWDPIKEAAERERIADALLASIMSTSGEKEETVSEEKIPPRWIQSSAKENYYTSNPAEIMEGSTVGGTQSLKDMLAKFKTMILDVYAKAKAEQPKFEVTFKERHHHHHGCNHSGDSSCSDSSSDSEDSGEENAGETEMTEAIRVLRQKEKHPARLGRNLWYNDPGQLNDRPLCRCSLKARKSGIRHNIFPGELPYPRCDPLGNNLKRLHHYTVKISPCTNFVFRHPTVITHDGQEFFFEGISLFSHAPLGGIPPCTVVRFGLEYTLSLVEEPPPENFTVQELDHFSDYLFTEILELYDFDYRDRSGEGCRRFHLMPRFARLLPENGKEILSMHRVMLYLINIRKPVMTVEQLPEMLRFEKVQWSRFLQFMHSMIVSCPGKKPSSVRVDQVDRDHAVCTEEKKVFPLIIHAGVMPSQLTYAANPRYKKLYKSFLRMRHLFKNRSIISEEEQRVFIRVQEELAELKRSGTTYRETTSELDCSTVVITGIRTDVCQHALIVPVLIQYLRYHVCLDKLNDNLGNIFTDKILLKRAMTHPSHRLTFGMNSDHIRNSLYNCALRTPEFGTKSWQQTSENRKKGIINLVKVMSRLAEEEEVLSNIHHYERLEFLGDAVVEFITSTALYHLFPNLEEGGLAMYRQALVENQHLAKIAKKMELEHFMLYSHGPDLCRHKDLDHAMANCFEALMGAIFLERGIDEARRIFCTAVFDEEDLRYIWIKYPKHPLQQQFPDGDRHTIEKFPVLKRMTEFEERTGMTFKNIRLLARAFTQRTMNYNDLTLGHNQRMEFLGDSVLQLVVSAYLFKHFPEHHEGHLSLLRSSLVNNNTQSIICQDLGLEEFMIDVDVNRFTRKVSTKLQADLLEALIGALYVDSGLDIVRTFCDVCFFPRLREFIIEQDWNDDKSKLQQVVLTLRKEGAEQPDVPHYKLLKKSGPANVMMYTVACFFKDRKIGMGTALSIRMAEKMAARDALSKGQYEQIKFQTKLMSSLYPKEFKPPEIQNPRNRPKKLPLPKQYALPSPKNRRDKR